MKESTALEQICNCINCGNRTVHTILFQTDSIEEFYNTNDPSDITKLTGYYYLARCKTCYGISLFNDHQYHENVGNIDEAYLCYPINKKPSEEIPQLIANTYYEALKVEKVSPLAFAILIRKALEQLCLDQNATGKNLKQQLEDLAKKGIIPKVLSEMADTVRELGNLSAHATEYNIDFLEVEAVKDFFLAMLEYVYVAPAKVAKLKASISKKIGKP